MTGVLWLTPEVPEPGGSGGAIRAFHLLRGLARRGLQPTVVAPAYPDQAARAEVLAAAGVALALVPRPESRVSEAASAHARHPRLAVELLRRPFLGWQGEVFWTEIEHAVQRQLAGGPAAVIVEHDFCLPWAERLPPSLPAAFAAQNAVWVQLARDADAARGVRRALLRAESVRFRRLVAGALHRYSWGTVVSEQDAAAFNALGAPEVELAPNGAATDAHAAIEPGGGEPGELLFCGTLSYPPNADAVRWLAREVLPRIRRDEPGARLTVVGRGAPPDLEALAAADPAITLLGWVDDLAPRFAAAAVALAPLRSGGGTRLKVIEALAAGRAMVATTIGAEGLDLEDGVHLRLADDADMIAAATVELLRDPDARRRLGAAGRERVRERYDWTAIADAFAAGVARWVERA